MRILWFILFTFSAFIFPWWVLLIAALFYMFFYTEAYELLVLAVLLDALYGTSSILPFPALYTLSAAFLLFVIEILKPYLSFYGE